MPSQRLLLAVFVAAIFVSAALLFAVQPMFAKMVLPRFGGAPSVWSVAMVFFQSALLAGYAYAHLLTRYAPGRRSVAAHLVITVLAAFTLPLGIAGGWGKPPETGEELWLLGLFAASIGPAFFALSANGPLLQAWFARTDHPAAQDPYFLYAASNAGSFLALVSYPFLVEPFIPLGYQTVLWSIGYGVLIVLIGFCGALLWRAPGWSASGATIDATEAAPPTWRDAALWTALAAVPAGLVIAVTAYISTDLGATPLLWVIPLALYLASFVIVFQRRPLIPHTLALQLLPLAIFGLVVVVLFDPFDSIVVVIAIHLLVFFICALVCHGELARRRPAARHLTSFYMWISAGGMIGGIATGLIAAHVFNWVAEYPILIALAVLCLQSAQLPKGRLELVLRYGALAGAVLIIVFWNVILGPILALLVVFWRWPVPFAVTVAALLLHNQIAAEMRGTVFTRSFFGVHRISEAGDGQFRLLSHGNTVHGAQRIRDANRRPIGGRPEPLTYYFSGGALAQTISAARNRAGGPIRIGVVGLGAGSLACQVQPGDTVAFYEIDPAVIRIARNPQLFSFLSACGASVPIVLGDARLTLAEAPDASYDIIVVDAFSADAVPIHLLTREAMAIYLGKLRPGGLIVMHVSNRSLELTTVVAGIAASHGLTTLANDSNSALADESNYLMNATVVAVARGAADFGALAQSGEWQPVQPDPQQRVWTDDYSNTIAAIIRKLRE